MKIEVSTLMGRVLQKFLTEEIEFESKYQTNTEVKEAIIKECEKLQDDLAKNGIEKYIKK